MSAQRTSKGLAATAPVTAIELAQEVRATAELMDLSLAPATLRAYRHDWSVFETWSAARGASPKKATPIGIAAFLRWLHENGRKAPGIERAYAGVIYHLRREDSDRWMRGRRHEECLSALRAIRRLQQHEPTRKRPVLVGDPLTRLLAATSGGGLTAARDRALILIGLAGAFRRSELVALTVPDLVFEDRGVRILLRRSKTDQEGKGQWKGITRAISSDHCPVIALTKWLERASIVEGFVFRAIDRHENVKAALGDSAVARIVKRLVTCAGLGDAKEFAGHSLRSGFVTSAVRAHKSIDVIMKQTGHKNVEVLMGYIRRENVFEDNALEGLL